MAKKNKRKYSDEELQRQLTAIEMQTMQNQYAKELDTSPEFSLEPDPTGELKLSVAEKCFIQHYVNFKSIASAAELAGIDVDVAQQYFVSFKIQCEIRRINRALYHRQFQHKLLTLDDLGGYLSSLLTDENVPIANQLKTNEKLRVVELIMRLNEVKSEALQNPGTLIYKDIDIQLQELSVETIQQLLASSDSLKEKQDIVAMLDDGTLSPEEKDYLKTLPLSELLKLVDDINKGGKK